MCGGGGGFNPVKVVTDAVSSVGNALSGVAGAVTTAAKQIGDVVVNDINTIGNIGTHIAHGQFGAALNDALVNPFQDINIMTGGKNGVTQSTPAQGASSGNINQPGNNGPVGGSSASTVTQAGGAVSGVNQTTPMITINSPYPMNKNTLIGLNQ